MDVGIFLPTGTNGFIMSANSPQYSPSFAMNHAITQRAEHYGLEFVLSMTKLRGLGGTTGYWDGNLDSFTLMAGLASVTNRIRLIASIAVLTMPPPIAARMAMTIDDMAPDRFGVNIVSGWLHDEYRQMDLWPGDSHYAHRYEYCAEYVQIMRDLWSGGRSDLKGEYFTMTDCRLEPIPRGAITVVCAGQSDRGTQFAAEYGDFNFCSSFGVNEPMRVAPSVERLTHAARTAGRRVGALVGIMVITDETDAAAQAKWQHYRDGVDLAAIAYRVGQAGADPSKDPYATPNRRKLSADPGSPVNSGVLIGSYASIAGMLDQMASIPGVDGVMLSFDDYLRGIEQFGQFIQPLMTSRTAP